jgi:nicotinamidase/pyrazinamidase
VVGTASKRRALIVVDVQNDFCPGGSLAVPRGDEVVPVINKLAEKFKEEGSPIYASRDRHPARTRHFKGFGGAWPPHCIKGSKGAEFHPKLSLPRGTIIISKGMDPEKDSYSAFHGESKNGKDLLSLLKKDNIKEVWVCGLATDYCVKSTALDARNHGFDVALVLDGVRSVDVSPGDGERAVLEMLSKGVKVVIGGMA